MQQAMKHLESLENAKICIRPSPSANQLDLEVSLPINNYSLDLFSSYQHRLTSTQSYVENQRICKVEDVHKLVPWLLRLKITKLLPRASSPITRERHGCNGACFDY